MTLVLVILTLAAVAIVLTRPFRVAGNTTVETGRGLEEAKRAKYRELRELELDWRTGKLTDTDYQRTRSQLRREAAQLLERQALISKRDPTTNGAQSSRAPGPEDRSSKARLGARRSLWPAKRTRGH